jgi:hypothetical protein
MTASFLEAALDDRLSKFLATMFVGCLGVTILVWLMEIGPYARKRTGHRAFVLLPWAPWQDYRVSLASMKQRHREPRLIFKVFKWITWLDVVCLLSLGVRLMFLRF